MSGPNVLLEATIQKKTRFTDGTLERQWIDLLVNGANVTFEAAATGELLSTHVALKRLGALVHGANVPLEVGTVLESCFT